MSEHGQAKEEVQTDIGRWAQEHEAAERSAEGGPGVQEVPGEQRQRRRGVSPEASCTLNAQHPSRVDVERLAHRLGMNMEEDEELLPIVEKALTDPLPHGWIFAVSPDNKQYFALWASPSAVSCGRLGARLPLPPVSPRAPHSVPDDPHERTYGSWDHPQQEQVSERLRKARQDAVRKVRPRASTRHSSHAAHPALSSSENASVQQQVGREKQGGAGQGGGGEALQGSVCVPEPGTYSGPPSGADVATGCNSHALQADLQPNPDIGDFWHVRVTDVVEAMRLLCIPQQPKYVPVVWVARQFAAAPLPPGWQLNRYGEETPREDPDSVPPTRQTVEGFTPQILDPCFHRATYVYRHPTFDWTVSLAQHPALEYFKVTRAHAPSLCLLPHVQRPHAGYCCAPRGADRPWERAASGPGAACVLPHGGQQLRV